MYHSGLLHYYQVSTNIVFHLNCIVQESAPLSGKDNELVITSTIPIPQVVQDILRKFITATTQYSQVIVTSLEKLTSLHFIYMYSLPTK